MRSIYTQLLVSGTLFLNASGIWAQEFDWTQTNINAAKSYIAPKYESLALVTRSLRTSLDKLCQNPLETKVGVEINASVKNNFKDVISAWVQVQHLQFGPIRFLNRYERFQYWPDKHGATERQLRSLLNSLAADVNSLATGTAADKDNFNLSRKSVAVQGLGALERLLYADQTLDVNACFLSVKIAENLDQIASEVDSSWRLPPVNFADEFALAGKEQGSFGSSFEITTLLATSLLTQLQLISDYKIGKALPKEAGGRIGKSQLEAWRSGLSMALIENSLSSLQSLYEIVFRARLATLDEDLSKRIDAQFSMLLTQTMNMPDRLLAMIESDQQRPQVDELMQEVSVLHEMIGGELFDVLEIQSGFSAHDGD